jgi:hypothetical protein
MLAAAPPSVGATGTFVAEDALARDESTALDPLTIEGDA